MGFSVGRRDGADDFDGTEVGSIGDKVTIAEGVDFGVTRGRDMGFSVGRRDGANGFDGGNVTIAEGVDFGVDVGYDVAVDKGLQMG